MGANLGSVIIPQNTIVDPCEQLKCCHKEECKKGKACAAFFNYVNTGKEIEDHKIPFVLSKLCFPTEKDYRRVFQCKSKPKSAAKSKLNQTNFSGNAQAKLKKYGPTIQAIGNI